MSIQIKLKQREKKVLLLGGIIVILILGYHFAVWYNDMSASLGGYVDTRRIKLEGQLTEISRKADINKELAVVSSDLKEMEKGLLSGSKPPLAAAEIQRTLKNIVSAVGVDINLERTFDSVSTENDLYLGIPVEIGFTASTAKLKDILLGIKTSPLQLTVSEIKILVRNTENPMDVNATLTVKGFMINPQQNKNDKGDTNAP
jgi:hypothetical protein